MRLLILGATGRTGKWILEEALRQGYEVTCLVRKAQKLPAINPSVKVLEGSPDNISELEAALKGCDGIISALNISRVSDFPWSPLRTPPTFLSDVMKNVIQLTQDNPPRRVIICSAWGVGDTENDIPLWFKWLIKYSNIGVAYQDHERQEKELKSSKLDWTFVRPVGLINAKTKKTIRESFQNSPKPKLTISRASVAKYMVDAFKREDLVKKAPVISGG